MASTHIFQHSCHFSIFLCVCVIMNIKILNDVEKLNEFININCDFLESFFEPSAAVCPQSQFTQSTKEKSYESANNNNISNVTSVCIFSTDYFFILFVVCSDTFTCKREYAFLSFLFQNIDVHNSFGLIRVWILHR